MSRASGSVKLPVMAPRPPAISDAMVGAVMSLPSMMMARRR